MIGIYGGSFDPPHRGHLGVIENFWKSFPNCKLLLLIPNYLSPFKKTKGVEEVHILKMLSILIEECDSQKIKIEDFEIKKKEPSFTIETVVCVNQNYPNEEIYLIIGKDNLKKFSEWKDYKKILSLAKLLIFDRNIADNLDFPQELEIFRDRIQFIQNPKIDASSSEIRNMEIVKWEKYITPKVLDYIKKEKLYGC